MSLATTEAPLTPADHYALAAYRAGVPEDQLRNFARAGVVLQERQLAASAAARACDAPDGPVEVGYGGSRGSGKSHWMVAQIVADDCVREPGLKCLILRKVGKAGKENFEDLRLRMLMRIPHRYNRHEAILTLANGSRVLIGHYQNESDIDAYLGLEYDIIGIEEATTLTEAKYRNIKTCNRTSKQRFRPRVYSTTNPGGIGHAFYRRAMVDPHRFGNRGEQRFASWKDQMGDTRFIPATVRDNAFVNREYQRTLESLTGWQRRAWLDGDWDIAAGQYFSTWRAELHVIDPFPIPKHWRVWASLDYGFAHYTVCHLFAQDGDGQVYIVDEHAARRRLPQWHAPAIMAMLARHGISPRHLWSFVASPDIFPRAGEPEYDQDRIQAISETYSHLLGVELEKANWDRVNGWSFMLEMLGDMDVTPAIPPRLRIFNTCHMLIEQIPEMQHDEKRPEDVLKVDCDDEGRGGDDSVDCLRYGLMAAWEAPRRYLEVS